MQANKTMLLSSVTDQNIWVEETKEENMLYMKLSHTELTSLLIISIVSLNYLNVCMVLDISYIFQRDSGCVDQI